MENKNAMTNQHPITPPPNLVQQWVDLLPQSSMKAFTVAAQWGSNQELEACCKWLGPLGIKGGDSLRRARRPKPPSLKEQALELARPAGIDGAHVTFGPEELALIRRALGALPND
jgi:hypothetical protein